MNFSNNSRFLAISLSVLLVSSIGFISTSYAQTNGADNAPSMIHGGQTFAGNEVSQLMLSASRGDPVAQNQLGLLYMNGIRLETDYKLAFHWLEKSAKQRNPYGIHNLATMYYAGMGMEVDYQKALKLYQKSAKLGLPKSNYVLGFMYYRGDGVKQDYVKAKYWFDKGAEQNNHDAQFMLGLLYVKGFGVEQDYDMAQKWMRLACDNHSKQGNEISCGSYKIYKKIAEKDKSHLK